MWLYYFLIIFFWFVNSPYFTIPSRYGWFSNLHSEASGISHASVEAPSESDNVGKIYNSFSSITSCQTEQIKIDSQAMRNSFDVHEAADATLTKQTSAAATIEHMVTI